jgi:predicted DNA-binding transcriptional regulator AlpA
MSNTNQLVNLKHAANLCGISRTLFYRLLNDERGPRAVEIDGARFFDRSVLEEWNLDRKALRKKGARHGTHRKGS